ncbi:kinase-like domain-containing protein [Phascolomyces articulosus]|uniref:Kinase-like domain-containing protein n=1 Tax=Phascolomyces articulosus TaxID=60185 RepID=A0AAD5PDN3_9FUNG|nr:kinase-like domain-containing protein [Phascolomyces articulosus]
MSQVKTDKSTTSSITNVSSPLRFELRSALTPSGKRSSQSQDVDNHEENPYQENENDNNDMHTNQQQQYTSSFAKRTRIDNNTHYSPSNHSTQSSSLTGSPSQQHQPYLLRKLLTPTRSSSMSDTQSNLFDHSDIITQERLKASSLNSSEIGFSSNSPSSRFDTRNPLVDRDKSPSKSRASPTPSYFQKPQQTAQLELQQGEEEEEEEEDLPLASFGWPVFLDDVEDDYNNVDDEDEEVTINRARRSLVDEFKSSEIGPVHDSHLGEEEDEQERLQSSRNLLHAVMGDIGEENSNDEEVGFPIPLTTTATTAAAIPMTKNNHLSSSQQYYHHAPPSVQHFDDECDEFFTSHAEDNIATERLPSSSLRRNYGPSVWQRIKPAYLATQPRFLTQDYFQQHYPTSCMEEEEQEEEELYEDEVPTSYFEEKYLVLQRLGEGEYAEVFKVQHLETKAFWAIKKSIAPFVSYDDRWQQIIEVDHMRAVHDCKQCVKLTDAWEQEGYLFLQMELCANGSLADYINFQNRNIPESDVWSILFEIAQGVKAIHDSNIIHLDLKPSNVLIDDAGSIKIGDFGVSVREPVDLQWVKGEGDRRYMAPDLLRDQFHKPADIFSLGLMVLEMAAGIVLPGTGEAWEELRIADFSGCEEALAKTSLKMREFIEWLMQTNAQERPTIDQVLNHPELVSRKSIKSSSQVEEGILYDYVQELKQRKEEHVFDSQDENDLLDENVDGEMEQPPSSLLPPSSPLPSPLHHQAPLSPSITTVPPSPIAHTMDNNTLSIHDD